MRVLMLSVFAILMSVSTFAGNWFVSVDGDDANAGDQDNPFRTIQKAADSVTPGDTCFVRTGTYRETVKLSRSGRPAAPIRFKAYPGEVVILDGVEQVTGPWTAHKGAIYRTHTHMRFEQLFANREMMLEARWPNATFETLMTRDGWATAGPQSAYQKLHDPQLADTGIDWTGATAILNIAHQFWSWSRPVLNHTKHGDTFEYRIKMNEFHSKRTHWWADDRYYLVGKLDALDSPCEWFLDSNGTLYLWAPGGAHPATLSVQAKTRDYAFTGRGMAHVEVSGFHMFACTVSLLESHHCVVEHCNMRFPSFARGVPDSEEPRRKSPGTLLTGNDNVVRSCSLEYCANFGVKVNGLRNLVENCLIHDVNWSGTLRYTAISLGGDKDQDKSMNASRGNTVYNVGNTIINSSSNRYGVIEYNHVHHGGLLSKDVSLIYTCLPYAMGNEIRYNWVHDSLSPSNSLGIRGDDKTRGMRVHHNVIWNVRRDAIITKGGLNRVYNNTCFANGASDILFLSGREPDKWWQKWAKAYEHQNEDSLLVNNCANVICSTRRRHDPGLPGDNSNNYTQGDPRLADALHLDFRPRPDSPLIDAGRAVEGITSAFKGKAPDIGAYEYGGEYWIPGHHNGVWVSRTPEGGLRATVAMPVLEPVTIGVAANDKHLNALTFTPDNWMHSQEFADARLLHGRRPVHLRFSTAAWGSAEVRDARTITPLNGARARFALPDLASAKQADPKFDYEEVYQPVFFMKSVIRAFKTTTSVKPDGRLDREEWAGMLAERRLLLTSLRGKVIETYRPAGWACVLFDEANLYVGFNITTKPVQQPGNEKWGRDDGVEFDFRTVQGRKLGQVFVLHGFPSGTCVSVTTGGASRKQAADMGSAVQYGAQVTAHGWTAEFAIPLKALGVPFDEIDRLRCNMGARCSQAQGGPWFAYARTGGANYDVDGGAVLFFSPCPRAEADNIVSNGSFESDKLSPWRVTSNSREPIPEGTVERVREGPDNGWCIRLQSNDADMMSKRVIKWTFPVRGKVKPGTYCLAYDLKLRALTPRAKMGSFNSYVHVTIGGKSGRNVGQQDSLLECKDLPWIRRDLILEIPEHTEPSMLSLQLHKATGTVWIDNVSLLPCE